LADNFSYNVLLKLLEIDINKLIKYIPAPAVVVVNNLQAVYFNSVSCIILIIVMVYTDAPFYSTMLITLTYST